MLKKGKKEVKNLQFSEIMWGALTGHGKNLGKVIDQAPAFLRRMIDAIENRLAKENRTPDAHVDVDPKIKRIIMDVPTMPKSAKYHSDHHRITIQVVDELKDPKQVKALMGAIDDATSQEHEPRIFDSGTLFILAGRISKEVEKEFKTNKLVKHSKATPIMRNRKVAIINKTPLVALTKLLSILRGFYSTRVRKLNEKEEKLIEDGILSDGGYFGDFGTAFSAFKRYVLKAVGEIAQAINSLIKQTKQSKFAERALKKGKATITSEAIERFGDFVGPPRV